MVRTNYDTLRVLANEKFTLIDTVNTYKKQIKPYTLSISYNDALPYLYEYMPNYIEIRLRQDNQDPKEYIDNSDSIPKNSNITYTLNFTNSFIQNHHISLN